MEGRPSAMAADPALASPPRPREIRSGRDLIAALNAPEPPVRFAALNAIKAQPEAAKAFGLVDGRDVIDALLARAAKGVHGRRDSEWLAVAAALSAFRDKRVVAFFVDVLETDAHPDLLFSAAGCLAAGSGPALRDRLRPLLLQNDSVARARAVASILVGVAPTCAEEQLRKALLTDGGGNPPRVDENNAHAWLAELDGPFREEARAAIEQEGERAFGHLLHRWDRLSDDNREWLAAWGLRAFAGCATSVVARALASDADRVARVALEFLAAHPRDSGADASALNRFAKHANPGLRSAAIAAGASVDLRRCLAEDDDVEVRRACVQRLADAEGVRALPDLVALLRGSDWPTRAAATRALIGLGDRVVEQVKPLVRYPEHGARVAAVQVLVALGQESWLRSQLTEAQAPAA